MKKIRLLIVLVALVMLPLLFVGWQGMQMQKNEEAVRQAQFQELISVRMQQVDNQIQEYLGNLGQHWNATLPNWKTDEASMYSQLATSPHVGHLFLLDKGRQRVFPSGELSESEQQFVQRLEAVWHDPQLLFMSDHFSEFEETQSHQMRSARKLFAPSESSISASTRQGWYRWHWGAGTHLIYWWQSPQGYTLGLELLTTRLKADIITQLPDSLLLDDNSSSLQLLDASDQVVNQWGEFDVMNETPLRSVSLSYPFTSWTLEYYSDGLAASAFSRYSLLILLGSFALLLLLLAWYLYREHTREIRLATQKVQFVGQVSHELKTPLTNIRMYAEMLEDSLDEEPQQQRYLQVIVNESQRLTRLITNVLNFSRQPRVHKTLVNTDQVIRNAVEHFAAGFEEKGITINQQLNANCHISTDPDLLEQILNNLLSNVEKYAVSGKRVDLSSTSQSGKLQIRVCDYGEGIQRGERKRIFRPFYRIHDKLTEGVSGTGIGLTIARQQARLLGGDLRYVEPGRQQGACFELTLPIETQA